jgi:hypothetical protein
VALRCRVSIHLLAARSAHLFPACGKRETRQGFRKVDSGVIGVNGKGCEYSKKPDIIRRDADDA